ncbi:MAG: molybdopterin molybdotransferase MoeA [Syntrophomonas sp.]|uniref:molybdopterin molybdotransferase MoeA n=1 Tax=Syntrophomonas sp. TaxID=2053627 RepID=UPI002630D673|nr:gephyrin-like molybdotransferase Glp [Syntrophomonas sp.]MDD2510267.1 molybdopterin molybdotransferase MoeA [Syntrophomonas sp.]MDD3879284.1 molybdopterin molybdotransferase MoeA [Syntrophomonas sp.]MDD4627026.1 molybdopterin molybdotransferase MoeA [Syntrophomonas sp.]
MAEFLKVVSFQEARQKIKEYFPRQEKERVFLTEAQRRVLASDVQSPEDLPAFHRTVVDGYALLAEDTFGSSESLPAYLDYVGEVKMGQEAGLSLQKGQCCWIPTGGMLPAGSNAAVMVEYTEKLGEDTVLVYRPVGPWENIMQKGEDIRKEEVIFPAGSFLRAQDIGLLASLGITELTVLQPWRVGLISTGDEIVPIEETPTIGKVRDVNSHALAAAIKDCGAIPHNYPLVMDDFMVFKNAVELGLRENDLLIMSGGSSVGLMDVTLDVLLSFPGAEMLFHGIAVKPGKPTLAVKIGDKMVIGLPGHPVSALMMFHIICAPALSPYPPLSIDARLELNLSSQAGRDDFVPVELHEEKGEKLALPLLGKSGLMNILSRASGFIHIPYEKQGLVKGENTRVYLFA